MRTKQEIAAGVRQAVTDLVGYTHSEITDEKCLETDLALNMLDKVELVMNVEENFEICITEDEENEVRTVGNLIEIATRKLEEKGQVVE